MLKEYLQNNSLVSDAVEGEFKAEKMKVFMIVNVPVFALKLQIYYHLHRCSII